MPHDGLHTSAVQIFSCPEIKGGEQCRNGEKKSWDLFLPGLCFIDRVGIKYLF